MHCPGGNANDPIWRVLASSQGISTRTPLKPQYSNPNPNRLANQLWCIDYLTPPTPLIIPHIHPAFIESLMPLKNWCSIHARCSKSSLKHSICYCDIFPSLKHNFIAYRSSKVSRRPDCIFEIHQLWQSGFSMVYSNCCCSCSFEPELIKIGQSSLIRCIAIRYWIFKSLRQFKMPVRKSLETYWRIHVQYLFLWMCPRLFVTVNTLLSSFTIAIFQAIFFFLFCISASFHKVKLTEVSIDGALWRNKFCLRCTSVCIWLLFDHIKQGFIFHNRSSSWTWFVFEVSVFFRDTS